MKSDDPNTYHPRYASLACRFSNIRELGVGSTTWKRLGSKCPCGHGAVLGWYSDIVEHGSRRNDDDSEQAAQVLETGHNLTMWWIFLIK
jgi:hypothetical protein